MQNITKQELQEKISNNQELFLIDVREPNENLEFNIGGVLLPLGDILNFQVDKIEHLKEKQIVCYCRSGNRSGKACLFLEQIGFKNVSNLVGGMLEWNK